MQPGMLALAEPYSVCAPSVEEALRTIIGQCQFEHWFGERTRLVIEDDALVVQACSPFLMQWIQKQFRGALVQAAAAVCGPAARVRFEAGAALAPDDKRPLDRSSNASRSIVLPAVADAAIETPASAPAPAETRPSEPSAATEKPRPGRRFANLSDFVAGRCSQLALTAIEQLCGRPLANLGPLYLYGSVGTGKTHLLEGTYRQLRRAHPQLQTLFLTSEQFTNYFTQAYRDHTLPAFRQRFRTVDVLLVDDVDFFDGKRVVQEEFLHTFRHLESHGKLLVGCGDRHPRLLTKISDELRTRLLSGMLCRLDLPDLETRVEIVSRRAARLNSDFTPEALRYVAERFTGSVRELEGALHSLHVYGLMTGRKVGITAARETLADLERDCLRIVRLADVERVVCGLYGLSADELRSSRRARSVSEPRMLAMYLARRHTRSAYSEIGRHFGGRNHATVISAERKVAGWLAAGAQLHISEKTWQVAELVQTLEQQLLAG